VGDELETAVLHGFVHDGVEEVVGGAVFHVLEGNSIIRQMISVYCVVYVKALICYMPGERPSSGWPPRCPEDGLP
jgi:hypothetical protein